MPELMPHAASVRRRENLNRVPCERQQHIDFAVTRSWVGYLQHELTYVAAHESRQQAVGDLAAAAGHGDGDGFLVLVGALDIVLACVLADDVVGGCLLESLGLPRRFHPKPAMSADETRAVSTSP